MITVEILRKICPFSFSVTFKPFVDPLNNLMSKYHINTTLRIRHFIAQLAHESGEFKYVKELASGQAYEGRKDLGNIHPGDGVRFKGRGLIQITGRNNYLALSKDLFADQRLIDHPELLEQPENAVLSACWFWGKNGLNKLADNDDIKSITKKINGGYNGLSDRVVYYARAKKYIQ